MIVVASKSLEGGTEEGDDPEFARRKLARQRALPDHEDDELPEGWAEQTGDLIVRVRAADLEELDKLVSQSAFSIVNSSLSIWNSAVINHCSLAPAASGSSTMGESPSPNVPGGVCVWESVLVPSI